MVNVSNNISNKFNLRRGISNKKYFFFSPEKISSKEGGTGETFFGGVESVKISSEEPDNMSFIYSSSVRNSEYSEDISSSLNDIIKAKRENLKNLKKELNRLNKDDKTYHGLNIAGIGKEELITRTHKVIEEIENKIEKLERDIKKFELKKLKLHIDIPEDMEDYFCNMKKSLSLEKMIKIINTYKELNSGKTSKITEGNKITPLEESEVWQEMINLLDIPGGAEPVEINAQYYILDDPKICKKLKAAANKGHKVKIFIDPGSGLEKHKKTSTADGTSMFRCLKNLTELFKDMEGKNFSVSLAAKKNTNDIMHRKILRVGEKVFIGGMNGGWGSGENFDYGMIIEGPAAKELGDMFLEDVEKSSKKNFAGIFGNDTEEILEKGFKREKNGKKTKYDLLLSPGDFCDFLILLLPQKSQEKIKNSLNIMEKVINILKEYKKNNLSLGEYGRFKDLDGNGQVENSEIKSLLINRDRYFEVKLTEKGRKVFLRKIRGFLNKINSEKNQKLLKEGEPPQGNPSGIHKMYAGYTPEELQALVIHTISSAEEFLYIPGYFITKDIAKLITEKKKKMNRKGKNLDVRVVIEPAMIPQINIDSYLYLEDNNIPVRWAALNGSGIKHNRKLHSKMLVSDKVMVTGSTNLSKKGLFENWETSVMVFVDPDNMESISKRDE